MNLVQLHFRFGVVISTLPRPNTKQNYFKKLPTGNSFLAFVHGPATFLYSGVSFKSLLNYVYKLFCPSINLIDKNNKGNKQANKAKMTDKQNKTTDNTNKAADNKIK